MTSSVVQSIREEQEAAGLERSMLTRRDAHDIHAQLINLKGFMHELNRVIGNLRSESAGWTLDPLARQHIDETLDDDVATCCRCLAMSIDRMEEKIDSLARSEAG